MSEITLSVNGVIYGGWIRMAITRTMESLAGTFELTAVDRWADGRIPWPILEEDACTVLIDGKPVMKGFVDERHLSYDAESHEFTVRGRDACGALADCSADLKSWHFANTPVLQIAQALAKPFGVQVTLDPAASGAVAKLTTGKRGKTSGAGTSGKRTGLQMGAPPGRFTIAPGETAFFVLDRLCRSAGLVPISDGLGGILLTRGGAVTATGAIEEGQNVLSASASYNAAQRFSKYIVVGQKAGSDQFNGKAAAAVKQSAIDPAVRRTERVTWIRAAGSVDQESARQRAAWEVGIRRARGSRVEVAVNGWTQPDGSVWPVNALVSATLPNLGVSGTMLITSVTSTVDDSSGLITQMVLCDPGAFVPEPVATPEIGGWKELRNGA